MNNGVEDTRVVGVADDLQLRDEVSKDNGWGVVTPATLCYCRKSLAALFA